MALQYTPDDPSPDEAPVMELFGEFWHFNPRHLIGPDELDMVDLWQLSKRYGELPDAGGLMDQACIMLEAFDVMDRALSDLPASFTEV